MTLACVVAALAFSGDLNRDEQWLLGGAAGGTLLGILVGRSAARRAWLWGPLIGVLATCGAASIMRGAPRAKRSAKRWVGVPRVAQTLRRVAQRTLKCLPPARTSAGHFF